MKKNLEISAIEINRLLTIGQLQNLSPQQQKFAQKQFQKIYLQQMGKVGLQLSKKKKIQNNLYIINNSQQKQRKQQINSIQKRFKMYQERSTKNKKQKQKILQNNQDRWKRKISQIDHKIKINQQLSYQRANQQWKKSQDFWFKRKQFSLRKYPTEITVHRYSKNQNNGSKLDKYPQLILQSRRLNRSVPLPKSKLLSTLQDQTIIQHRIKSKNIIQKKQQEIFSQAIQKLQKIQKVREKKNKQKQKKYNYLPQKIFSHQKVSSRQKYNKQLSLKNFIKRTSIKQKIIQQHIQRKQKIQAQYFQKRSQILEKSINRNKKIKIIKVVRDRVHELKLQSLKRQR